MWSRISVLKISKLIIKTFYFKILLKLYDYFIGFITNDMKLFENNYKDNYKREDKKYRN